MVGMRIQTAQTHTVCTIITFYWHCSGCKWFPSHAGTGYGSLPCKTMWIRILQESQRTSQLLAEFHDLISLTIANKRSISSY